MPQPDASTPTPDAGGTDGDDEGSCSCAVDGSGRSAGLLLFGLLALLGWRRRR